MFPKFEKCSAVQGDHTYNYCRCNDIGNMKTEMYELKGDSKTIIELQSDLKNLTKSVDEIKGTNHDTYLLLLDMQKQYR